MINRRYSEKVKRGPSARILFEILDAIRNTSPLVFFDWLDREPFADTLYGLSQNPYGVIREVALECAAACRYEPKPDIPVVPSRTLRETAIENLLAAGNVSRPRRTSPPPKRPRASRPDPDAARSRVTLRGKIWYCDETACANYQAALKQALTNTDMLPQPGNSERGSRLVAAANLERARGAGV